MNLNLSKSYYFIITFFIIVLVIIITFALRFLLQNSNNNSSISSDVEDEREEEIHIREAEFDQPNPTYIEILKIQPYLDMLPYRTETYLVERIMHNDTILITTINPEANNPERQKLLSTYRNQALEWLASNGADIDNLNIEFSPKN